MNRDLVLLALVVGAFTWAFRVLPTRLNLSSLRPDGLLSRFMALTGPAAIAALFVASILPALGNTDVGRLPLACGTFAVLAVFSATRSVVGATLAGAVAYGVGFFFAG